MYKKNIEYIINENGCHICTSHSKTKLGYVKIGDKGKTCLIHRFMYSQKYGEIPKGFVIMHICDNPSCINLEHLKLGSYQDNMSDKMRKNRHRYLIGSENICSKLTEKQVIEIRTLLKEGNKQKYLAEKYNVAQQTISRVKCGVDWKQVEGEVNNKRKLDMNDVIEIRNTEDTCRNIAKKYNVHYSTIAYIKKRKLWHKITEV